ncbi:PIN domain-containing protein [Oscillatoria sp. CS-180]|uniref:type II toxin-antitoxin system VapC family toxin n=1 Tax=Oscillatoria sp. CS-180 TaxID=3021720 RepID=UPI00232ABCFE|nr:PIN domain-containing protein [Oscillatoria sp. CS-180]MDB9526273.1 PIN domain-containing protein [Oscillatoria sp. CS-180]
MTRYLLDTNILVRASDEQARDRPLAINAVAHLLTQSHDCVLSPQVLVEFWAVATRPAEVNGLGWSVDQCQQEVEQFLGQFPLIEDKPESFRLWLTLVQRHKVVGKRVHDARLAATMLANDVSHIITFNLDDFASITEITPVHPQTISA